MSMYEQLKKVNDDRDADAYLNLLGEGYVFVRHQSGTELSKAEWAPMVTAMMSSNALEIGAERCIYENDEILVMHQIMKFADGSKEAVMIVHSLKEGKIIRSETGATPIKQ